MEAAVNRWARATDPIQRGARGQQNPVDLPLRLDDASASPTTPQGQHQQALITETEKELRPGLEGPMRQREPACEATLDVSGRFADRQYGTCPDCRATSIRGSLDGPTLM